MNAQKKIDSLRRLMKKYRINAYLIPSTDPHQNEYVPEFWQRRKFISDFTGSAGEVAVTNTKAGLWTDSRYFIQAEQQLDAQVFTLFKAGLPDVPTINDWLLKELKPGKILGVDPQVISLDSFKNMETTLAKGKIKIKCIPKNLVDAVWKDRPTPPHNSIKVHEEKYTGESVTSKLKRLREKMAGEHAEAHVITRLDSISWLFNIRGSDIKYNPVVIAYAIIEPDKASLFVDESKVTDAMKKTLSGLVSLRPYEDMEEELRQIAEKKNLIWIDGSTANQHIIDIIGIKNRILNKPGPIVLFKALKNKTEIQGIKNAHIRDGAAVVKFLAWLDTTVGQTEVSEISAADKLADFRSHNSFFQGLSFETISSYGNHSAIVHYAPTPESDAILKPEGIYLIDSGGQYLDGTTDITRTIALGPPTEEEKDRFTRVLQGLIGLSSTSFPKGTVGKQLDTIARLALWEKGLNFLHGTGHGIGHFLNVHEGPQAISYYRCIGVAFEPGMVQSIEPGYYKEGEYGMRVENVTLVVPNNDLSYGESEFFTFETLTMCPIDRNLINKELMCAKEIDWLDRYHKKVFETLAPLFNEKDISWLDKATQPI
jgi:Xaa-Pro aminopeptidase